MQRLILVLVTVMLACGIAVMFAWSSVSSAQTSTVLPAFEACSPDESTIAAAALPQLTQGEPEIRVFDLSECPVGNRVIMDGAAGSVLPMPGEIIYAESMTTNGAEELEVRRYWDGTIELRHVGADAEAPPPDTFEAQATGPNQCDDLAYNPYDNRLFESEPWYFNKSTTPSEIGVSATEQKLIEGGVNVATVRNDCGVGDAVGVGMRYSGNTNSLANIDTQGICGSNDGLSEVSFGDLPSSSNTLVLAVACNWSVIQAGLNRTTAADVKFNKVDATWTNNALSGSCRNRYGVEAVMTHERGHTFGLGHVSESNHGNLTMSTRINGPCQASETTLGRGDARGLYRIRL